MAATMMYRALHNYAATSEYECVIHPSSSHLFLWLISYNCARRAERRAQGERPPLVRVGKPDALRLEPLEITVFTTFEQHHDMDSEGEMARSKSGLSIRSRAHEDGGTPTLII
ncbi:hypothetical protein FA95DRAFT_715043 [Auriscalpium vulgare]|uniref:Uncharacterized protein n=1 Tax=Auriscalpium vulgare TaxID=40419 RepID=A0ACB8RCA1_9AGAM|nr:hypothetical protein FA95DRAFT_715043 [Auriscalpium vulgare]